MSKLLLLVALILQPSIALSAEFLAGTAKVDITPPVGGLMYGYGARGANVSTGVHDPLYAKAIVLDDGTTKLAIVALDLGSISALNTANVKQRVKSATGIENVLLVASHTHSAPSPIRLLVSPGVLVTLYTVNCAPSKRTSPLLVPNQR